MDGERDRTIFAVVSLARWHPGCKSKPACAKCGCPPGPFAWAFFIWPSLAAAHPMTKPDAGSQMSTSLPSRVTAKVRWSPHNPRGSSNLPVLSSNT